MQNEQSIQKLHCPDRDHVTVPRSTSHSSAFSSANEVFGGVMVWWSIR